jgi:adenylosuccinate lyase
VLPDASLVAYYSLRRATKMLDGLVVHAERMLENLLEGSYGLVFSQPVLLSLVQAGLTRDDAYRIVQRDARRAYEDRRGFREVLEKDPDVADALAAAGIETLTVLDQAFDLDRALRYAHRTIEKLKGLGE